LQRFLKSQPLSSAVSMARSWIYIILLGLTTASRGVRITSNGLAVDDNGGFELQSDLHADCECACQDKDSISLSRITKEDKGICHWSENHKYFWCTVDEDTCDCAPKKTYWNSVKRQRETARWTKCGKGSYHLKQLVASVTKKEGSLDDPCFFKDYPSGSIPMFLDAYRHEEKYPSGDPPWEEVAGLKDLADACEKHEPISLALQLDRMDTRTSKELSLFLTQHSAQSMPVALVVETCWIRMKYFFHPDLYDQKHDLCYNGFLNRGNWSRYGDKRDEIKAQTVKLCQKRDKVLKDLYSLLETQRKQLLGDTCNTAWNMLDYTRALILRNNYRHAKWNWGCENTIRSVNEWVENGYFTEPAQNPKINEPHRLHKENVEDWQSILNLVCKM